MSHFAPSHSLQGSFCKLQLLKMESQLEQRRYDGITELGCCNRNRQVENEHAGLPKHHVSMDFTLPLVRQETEEPVAPLLRGSGGDALRSCQHRQEHAWPRTAGAGEGCHPAAPRLCPSPGSAQDQVSNQRPWALGQCANPLLPHPTTAASFVVWPLRNLNGAHNI